MYTRAGRKVSETEFNRSVITDHAAKYNHMINWDEANIMDREDKDGTQTNKGGDLD